MYLPVLRGICSDRGMYFPVLRGICSNRGMYFPVLRGTCSNRGMYFSVLRGICFNRGMYFSVLRGACFGLKSNDIILPFLVLIFTYLTIVQQIDNIYIPIYQNNVYFCTIRLDNMLHKHTHLLSTLIIFL